MDGAKAVKRHNAQYDIFNRLHSISADQSFVLKVAEEWFSNRFEVVPNQRCGTWYCPPSTTYAYFKSTDGHTNNWNFNLRRANIQLASYAQDHGGLILVDSTRRGKRMPDALSKTIPIWCAVINRAVATTCPAQSESERSGEWQELYLPAGIVSPSEREQIISLLPTWTQSLMASNIPLPALKLPLRPFFIHHSTTQAPFIPSEPGYTPIICLSASRWVGITGQSQIQRGHDEVPSVTRVGYRNVGFEYIPGAGDDDELWAKGLTPAVFWQEKESLLRLDRDDLEDGLEEAKSKGLITAMEKLDFRDREAGRAGSSESVPSPKPLVGVPGPSSRLALDIGPPVTPVEPWSFESETSGAVLIYVVEIAKGQSHPNTIYPVTTQGSSDVVVAIPSPKTDSWGYKASLVKLVSYLRDILDDSTQMVLVPGTTEHLDLAISLASTVQTTESTPPPMRLDVLAKPADMVSARKCVIPIALLLLCAYPGLSRGATEEASEEEEDAGEILTKGQISSVLLSLVALWPDGNPPRAALKRVNEVLLSNPQT